MEVVKLNDVIKMIIYAERPVRKGVKITPKRITVKPWNGVAPLSESNELIP
jgi:ribosomal protein S1